jgi:hypothetical protein
MFVTDCLHGSTDEIALGINGVIEGFVNVKEVLDFVDFIFEGVVGDHTEVGTIDRDIHAETATTVSGTKSTTTVARGLKLA